MEEHKHIKEVISRLSKIEGHVRGIKKMLEEGKSCDQVLIQFSAVQAAMMDASGFSKIEISQAKYRVLGLPILSFVTGVK